MRLQLITAFAFVSTPAAADPGAEATLRVYIDDDDDITVVSPAVRAETALGATTIEANVTADAVTGASIDVVTSASPRPIDERRIELGLGGSRALPRTDKATLSAAMRGSHENDHDGVRGIAALRVELLQRRLTLDVRYIAAVDAIGTVNEPGFHRTRTLHQPSLGVTAVLDPLYLHTDEIEETIARVTRAGGRLLSPLAPRDWGDDVAYFADLDGHVIAIARPRT